MADIAVTTEEGEEAAEVVEEEHINLVRNPTRRMLSSSAADHEVAEEDLREAVTVVATNTRATNKAAIEADTISRRKRPRSR